MAAEITQNVPLPPRSRTFTQEDATAVLRMLKGEKLGEDGETVEPIEPAKNVGFGTFGTAGAARSAGVTLNKLLTELGAPHKYAVTTRERGDKFVGVLLNKPAKQKADAADETPAPEPTPRKASSGRRGGRR